MGIECFLIEIVNFGPMVESTVGIIRDHYIITVLKGAGSFHMRLMRV